MYTGLREMALLPVLSMKSGGLFWFTDLTVPDPYFALPLMTAATLLITVEVQSVKTHFYSTVCHWFEYD